MLRELEAEIAAHPPERGGALLGPPQRPLVTRFVPDPEAATISASYRPSRALDAAVKALERDDGLELKGIVHSHPRGVDRPSEQDVKELATGLALNGHLASYLAPIVTRDGAADLEPHQLALGPGRIGFFAATRARGGGVQVRPVRVRVVPLLRDLERLAHLLGCGIPETFLSDAGSGPLLAGRLRLEGELEVLVLAAESYPVLAPTILLTAGDGATGQVHVEWRLDVPEPDRLIEALRPLLVPPGPYRAAWGPPGGPALTRDPERARLAGWPRRFTGQDVDAEAERARQALLARGAGLLSPALRERHVLVAGCGSVGSYLAEQLVRSGVGAVTLLDPEAVEPENLSRTPFTVEDVGRPKVEALAGRLLRIDPVLAATPLARAVEALAPAELDAAVRAADLVVAATDDPAAQRSLNRFAYARGRPALFVGLYAGARGGEVLLSVPGRTPCYLCATRTRHEAEQAAGRVGREVDYGTGRLAGEVALGADVQHVASAAVKLGLSLLLPAGSGGELPGFAEAALADGTSYLTLSTVARYWFYPAVFGEVAGQGAYQSVWLTPTSSEDCPVCGAPGRRVDPLEVPLRAPGRAALAAAIDRGSG